MARRPKPWGRQEESNSMKKGASSQLPKKCRLVVARSNKHIVAQLLRDDTGETLLTVSDSKVKKQTKIERAREVGREVAKSVLKLGVKEIVFDRRSRRYHGRVRALAEGAREGGLNF